MAKRLLAITKQGPIFSGIEIEKQGSNFFAGINIDLSSKEALHSACREADEIYINNVFSSEIYAVDLFPKVKNKYLPKLIAQSAFDKLYGIDEIDIKYKNLDRVKDDAGVEKQNVAYVAIDKKEIRELLQNFNKFIRKVKLVTPLPISLANTVSKIDSLKSDFIIVLVGKLESMIVIASEDGIVKIARNIPLGIQQRDMVIEDDTETIAAKIEREINRTISFYKTEFRETEPDTAYILAHKKLFNCLSEHFISNENIEYRFSLKKSLIQNYSKTDFIENIEIITSVLAPPEFNFLKKQARDFKFHKMLYYPAAIACAACIATLLFYNYELSNNITRQYSTLISKHEKVKLLKTQVAELENKIGKLKPLTAWNVFYNQTFRNQIAWDKVFFDLGARTPPDILLKSMEIKLDEKDRFKADIQGDVSAVNWQEGLKVLREFGAKIEALKEIKTIDIKYAPESMGEKIKNFSFLLSLEIRKYGS